MTSGPPNSEKIVRMANQIGQFFVSQSQDGAASAIADHMRKFWDPRMRSQIIAHWQAGGEGLLPQAHLAVGLLARETQTPPRSAPC